MMFAAGLSAAICHFLAFDAAADKMPPLRQHVTRYAIYAADACFRRAVDA